VLYFCGTNICFNYSLDDSSNLKKILKNDCAE
jgi:hypothetical protein